MLRRINGTARPSQRRFHHLGNEIRPTHFHGRRPQATLDDISRTTRQLCPAEETVEKPEAEVRNTPPEKLRPPLRVVLAS